jgi:predicted O-methyltransferase YrrM
MKITSTQNSLDLVAKIVSTGVKTFHHHYHILHDIAKTIEKDEINYVEIGCYAGGSACLMLQRKNTNVVSIDLGEPISEEEVRKNVVNNNINNNRFNYIKGNSQIIETKERLKSAMTDYNSKEIDMLFIDGDHSYVSVNNDFNLYEDMVSVGGYIVFDDYSGRADSPELYGAVDEIVSKLKNYEIIGTIDNTLGAHPKELFEGNCFIIKKTSK